MTSVHAAVGIACASGLVVLIVWALAAKLSHRAPGTAFERTALVVGGLLGLQVVFGLVLLAAGHRKDALHYGYGIAALVVIAAGVGLARVLQRDRWVVLAWAAFIAGLLVLRAMMTGFHKAA
ncbi:MAG TPA: hypothetical protein VJ818_01980 [Actinomycetota bacterium]|nr:hypothetical protein [Actinomycetota bacterium]